MSLRKINCTYFTFECLQETVNRQLECSIQCSTNLSNMVSRLISNSITSILGR